MKRNIIIAVVALAMASCVKEKDPFAPTGGEPITVTSNVSEVVLDRENDKEVAVKFTWTKGYEYDDNVKVTYCFKIDIAENDFATATELEVLGEDVFEKSYTVEELNDLCLEQWDITPGEPVNLEAKVIARHTADKFIMPQVAVTEIGVKTYELTSSPLYIIGDAVYVDDVQLGWDPRNALKMQEEILSRTYSLKCDFRPGEYLFLKNRESLSPAYGRGEDKAVAYYEEEAVRLKMDREQTYTVRVNVKKGTLDLIYHPAYDNIYMVGDAAPNGWAIEDATPLTWVENTAEFVYEGHLNAGELKFAAGEPSWDSPFYMATVSGQDDLTVTSMQLVQPGGVDYKWKVTAAGSYRVTLDIDRLTIKFEKK